MVIEVGLGGTWDSTNVVHGDVAVLTNFSYDHTDVLGPTLEGIAEDKSGIIKAGSMVVVGETRADLVAIVEAHAARRRCAAGVWVVDRDFGCEKNRVAVGGRLVTLWTPGGRYEDVLVPLHGAHQGRMQPVPWPRPRRSSAVPSTPMWCKRVLRWCGCPVVSRSLVVGRSCWSTGRTTWPE